MTYSGQRELVLSALAYLRWNFRGKKPFNFVQTLTGASFYDCSSLKVSFDSESTDLIIPTQPIAPMVGA